KAPYRRTNHCKALNQMLLINQRLNKLAAARVDFTSRGMMDGALLSHDHRLETPNPRGHFTTPTMSASIQESLRGNVLR
ncbi:hypothetical protein K438DRAFT_1611198, partial [Mycena galopus ATCC 62051]